TLDTQSECLFRCRGPASQLAPASEISGCTADPGSGFWLRAAQPFVETDMADTRLAQRHQRTLLNPTAPISGPAVAHDLTGVTDCLQIAVDDIVERRSLRAGDLDDAVLRRGERHIRDDSSNVVRRDGLEQDGRKLDRVSIRARIGDAAEEFHKLGRAD